MIAQRSQVRRLVYAIGGALLLASPLAAQPDPAAAVLTRAMDAENQGRAREAIAAYREAIARGAVIPGVLGLERATSDRGEPCLRCVACGRP